MILKVDGQEYCVDLPSVSTRLANAKDAARRAYSISGSGYGIHWPDIDEDLTIAGLISSARPVPAKTSDTPLLLKEQTPEFLEKVVRKARLEALELEVNEELRQMAASEQSGNLHNLWPITDGVIDIDRFLNSTPQILWILKEPWEGEGGFGDWSLTQKLIPELIDEGNMGGNPTYRRMAYITYSVFNKYPSWPDIPSIRDRKVSESLKSIAYINISKFPGRARSIPATIESAYQRNQHILKKQIETINPDIVITGNIIRLFFEYFGLRSNERKSAGSVDYWSKDGRLYIDAYHPAYWRIHDKKYVEDIVGVIRNSPQGSKPSQL